MKSVTFNRRGYAVLAIGVLMVLVVSSTIFNWLYLQDSSENNSKTNIQISEDITYTSEREISEAQDRNGIPSSRGSVSASNIDYFWINETVVDGSYSCYLFNAQTYQIYGSTYTTAGFGSPSTSGRTYYQNQEYDIEFINETIDSVCIKPF